MRKIDVIQFDFDSALLEQFVDFPWKLYAGDKNWLAPNREAVMSQLSPEYPFFRHGKCMNFIARDEYGVPCGRVSAIINHNISTECGSVGYVGFFECVDSEEVAGALFEGAIGFLKDNNIDVVWGPLNFSTLHQYRLLTKGFDKPSFYTDIYNPPYYAKLFLSYGFNVLRRYYSEMSHGHREAMVSFQRIKRRAVRAGFNFRLYDPGEFDSELKLLHELVISIFGDNFAFSYHDYEEFRRIYSPYKELLEPEHLHFAHNANGEAVGFFLAIPDYSGHYPNTFLGKMLGVKPEYARTGVPAALVHDVLAHYVKAGYDRGIASLRIEGNPSIKYGADWYEPLKEYALFEYPIKKSVV